VHTPPEPAATAEPATWLNARLGVTDDWVTDTVGDGFAAYARIFHPLGDELGAQRWKDVASLNGRSMHSSAQWEHISCPPGEQIPDHPIGRGYPGGPDWGNLRPVFLGPLCDVLGEHTTTPDL
jgi:hypothetical protein